MAYADDHDPSAQDLVQAGGDTGDLKAAGGEQQTEKIKDKETSFDEAPTTCGTACLLDDEDQNVKNEHRPYVHCLFCEETQ